MLISAALAGAVAAAGPGLWSQLWYRSRGSNVILIVLDTLRADHLGSYGYAVNTSPNIDHFAREEAVLFETVIAQAPSTLPSHASIFTSMLPSHHGASYARRSGLAQEFVTMAEILKAAGYRTVSYNDGGQIAASWGIGQGFEQYVTIPGPHAEQKLGRNVEHATRWLADNSDTPFFLFLQTYEIHHPYAAESRFFEAIGHRNRGTLPEQISEAVLKEINSDLKNLSPEDREHIIAAYDAQIRSADEAFAGLLDELRRLGLYEDSLIILTSDHGEELGERLLMGWHSHALFEEQLLVPLVVKFPHGRFAGRRIRAQVRSIDILPTLLEILGLDALPAFEGSSLLGLVLEKEEAPRAAVSQQDRPFLDGPAVLREGGWKYYHRPRSGQHALFDLKLDPGERRDLLRGHRAKVRELRGRLLALLDARPTAATATVDELEPELRRQLDSLGYLEE
jgi:arylsulfatase